MQLENKVAVITGAGAGMGLATTEVFLARGAKVVAADVSAVGLERWAGRDDVATIVADVTKRSDVEAMVQTAIDRFGQINVLVNNAGIMDRFLPVGELTDDVWNRVLAVNLTGPMMASRAAIDSDASSRGRDHQHCLRRWTTGGSGWRRLHRQQARAHWPHAEHCRDLWPRWRPLRSRVPWGCEHRHPSGR